MRQPQTIPRYLLTFFPFCLSNFYIFQGSEESGSVHKTFLFKFAVLVDTFLDTASDLPLWSATGFSTVLNSYKPIFKKSINHFWTKMWTDNLEIVDSRGFYRFPLNLDSINSIGVYSATETFAHMKFATYAFLLWGKNTLGKKKSPNLKILWCGIGRHLNILLHYCRT